MIIDDDDDDDDDGGGGGGDDKHGQHCLFECAILQELQYQTRAVELERMLILLSIIFFML